MTHEIKYVEQYGSRMTLLQSTNSFFDHLLTFGIVVDGYIICDFLTLFLQQAWSSRGQQLLLPAAWQPMAPVGPPPSHPPPPPLSSLTGDTTAGPTMLSDWG